MTVAGSLGCFTGLSKALKLLVQRSLLPQKEIARRAQVLESSLSKYLSGDINPGLGALGRIVEDGLGLTLVDLAEALQQVQGKSGPTSRPTVSVDELEDQVRVLLLRLRCRAEGGDPSKDEPWDDDSDS
jgi:transcriptional regulator with XRE-family HTH domain